MHTDVVYHALEIMGKGMASIFIVIIILTLIVVLLTKITNSKVFKKLMKISED
jgi:Na+-transporting methylmalonyl-CoA/oxaloacetate decarboxylase gamma subunit